MTTIRWWPTATGSRRHAVPTMGQARALCGLVPRELWAEHRAPLVEATCANCLRRRSPTPVTSSNVATMAHRASTGDLNVTFHNGGRYRYLQVPRAVYWELLTAPSVGTALAALVKDGGYRFIKYEPEAA